MTHQNDFISADDLYLFNEGRHSRLYQKLGAHVLADDPNKVHFAVWAPNAREVSVLGDFNDWEPSKHTLHPLGESGIWSGVVTNVKAGQRYQFRITSHQKGYVTNKSDPFGFRFEVPPDTSSIVWNPHHTWSDDEWMANRKTRHALNSAMSIYEIHLGSWRRVSNDNNRSLSYRELADTLPSYVKGLGFTHVEIQPVMEHPFFGSWGYQTTGYFAPTSRYGTPDDFKYLVDALHQHDIGVILDWVPSHFPSDDYALSYFDGTHLYEHEDSRLGYHPDWNSLIFNYGRNEVRSFLISSALYWLDQFHADGIRVDAVASMLYLDYSRKEGQWLKNRYGGKENLEAIQFLRELNETIYLNYPDVHVIAEESTSWPMVSRPTYLGGLGFGMKWDMGWMHDTLEYFHKDPVHRKFHQNQLTFRMLYAFNENFVLSFSHDEVVHGKGSLLGKMPGDMWQKFANVRTMMAYMYAQPGKKLVFMGAEFAQWQEWNHDLSLQWELLNEAPHAGVYKLFQDLNALYQQESCLHDADFSPDGFEWLDVGDAHNSVLSFFRKGSDATQLILCVFNLTPVPRENYRLGVNSAGTWTEILNTDAHPYAGSGYGNLGVVEATPTPSHGRPYSLNLILPPLGAVFLKWEASDAK